MLAAAILAIGLIFLVLSAIAFWRTRIFIGKCLSTTGRIERYTTEDSEDGVFYFAVIRFRDASGVEHELARSRGLQEPPTIGTPVPITYDPKDPTNAWPTGGCGPWVIPWLLLILGIAAVAAAWVIRLES